LYGVRAEAEGRISENQNLDLRDIQNDKVIANTDFNLDPIQLASVEENVTITLNNIFFDFDAVTLKPESFPELNRIVTLMKEKSGMQIEITGHTDATGPEPYNLQLSERRAKSVVKYLTSEGVAANRITVSFFGEAKPVAPN